MSLTEKIPNCIGDASYAGAHADLGRVPGQAAVLRTIKLKYMRLHVPEPGRARGYSSDARTLGCGGGRAPLSAAPGAATSEASAGIHMNGTF
jgi:hypothetical protein